MGHREGCREINDRLLGVFEQGTNTIKMAMAKMGLGTGSLGSLKNTGGRRLVTSSYSFLMSKGMSWQDDRHSFT